jgi:hypothetical protein
MIGEVINHLKQLNMYDKSLILVTSDHGCSFEPDNRNRGCKATIGADTMPVPFIIKLPYQQEGIISDENFESIDVFPTIADILNISIPWQIDGQSMLDTSKPKRQKKTLIFQTKQYVVDADNQSKYKSLERKLSIFGSGRTKPNGYFQIGRYGNLIGKATTDLQCGNVSEFKVNFNEQLMFDHVDLKDPYFVSCYLSGSISPDQSLTEPIHIAISVNGTIQAVTQTYQEPSSKATLFYAIIPEFALENGSNKIEFFVVSSKDNNHVQLSTIEEAGKFLLQNDIIKSSNREISIIPKAIKGSVSIVKKRGNTVIKGKIMDTNHSIDVEKIVVFSDGHYVVNIAPQVTMHDELYNRKHQNKRLSFKILIPNDVLKETQQIRVFAISDKIASELKLKF